MDFTDKLFIVLNAINEAYELTTKGNIIVLDIKSKELARLDILDIEDAIAKAHFEIAILKVLRAPNTSPDYKIIYGNFYHLEIFDTFSGYFAKFKKDYFQAKGIKEHVSTPKKDEEVNITKETNLEDTDKVILKVSYSDKTREILINDYFLVKNLRFFTINEKVFDYVFKNSNRKITKEQLTKALKEPINKRLAKIVNELGFTQELYDIFFSVSSDAIEFRNPIRKSDLDKIGLHKVRINIKKEPSTKKTEKK